MSGSRWRVVGYILALLWASVMAGFAMFGMSLAFGRSPEAAVHASIAAGTYLFLGLVVGHWFWPWNEVPR